MERRTIKVASVGSWRKVGKGELLEFIGDDHVTYETWSKVIGEHVKVGASLEADVEFTVKEFEGTKYIHNKLIELYIGGKAIGTQSKGSNWNRDRSPEDRMSIENQVRAKLITELLIADKIDVDNVLALKLTHWLSQLGETTPKTVQAQPAPVEQQAKASSNGFTNAGAFLSKCLTDLKLNKTQALKKLGVSDISEITDFKASYEFLVKFSNPPAE